MSMKKAWPDCTFSWESEDDQHFCGSHWGPFYDSADDVLRRLHQIIPQSTRVMTFGDTYSGPHEIPESWPKGLHLGWPNPRWGLITTLRSSEGAVEVANVSPYVQRGIQVSLEIEKVHVWASGVEAQIDAVWGEGLVSFYDLQFASSNRTWYEAGKRCDFILAGIAYGAGPAEDENLELGTDSALSEVLRAELDHEDRSPLHVSLDGASVFLPIPEWDRDDYSFRGPVLGVSAFDDWLGQSGWRVRVRVMQFHHEDAELEVFVTRRAWSHPDPPEVGQDISGTLWLQGRLWLAANSRTRSGPL